jgi:thermitase
MLLRHAHLAAAAVVLVLCIALVVPGLAAAAPQPRLVVGFHPSASPTQRSASLARAKVTRSAPVARLHATVVTVAPHRLAEVRRALLARADVAYVELDHVARAYDLDSQARTGLAASWVPSDTFLSQQWGLQTLRAEQAWELARGTGVKIAILDTGVDYIHPDLSGRVELGRDFVDEDSDPMDVQGHGTHVAGIAAATADDGFGIAGVAPGATILAVRVLDAEGAGDYSQVARGIVHAADRGAKVINLSLGGPEESELLRSAIDYATARGAIVTCASGNESASALGYPARYDSCLSVGATDSSDSHASFSNRGAGLDLVAPGAQVLSSVMGGSHDSWDGTSMATPHVAGVAALLASQGLGRRAIVDTLAATAVDLGPTGRDTTYGAGRVDAAAAVEAASRQPRAAADTTAPTVSMVDVAAVRRTTSTQATWRWRVRSRTGFVRVGTTEHRGNYQYVKVTRRGNRRTVDTFRFRAGIVYRRRVVQQRVRQVVRQSKVVLPITVVASDDTGVDRVSVSIDGVVAGIDWSAGDGWQVVATCRAGTREIVATAWDAADNGGSATVRRRVTC